MAFVGVVDVLYHYEVSGRKVTPYGGEQPHDFVVPGASANIYDGIVATLNSNGKGAPASGVIVVDRVRSPHSYNLAQ
jgi:hypothetical protein